ncbi:MAG: hypothetical protein HY720_28290, partial [Planctomycetes bacterium]|nr:hypothetical protein [Planctomycetota bacterium]
MGHARSCLSKRASVLVVVLGVLIVLSTLAIAFARISSLERTASTTRVDEVRARFLAWAGVERALAEARVASQRPWDAPDAAWFYRGTAGNSAGNGVLLAEATLPSFLAGNDPGGRAYSGSLPPTYEPLGDTYVVKVLDAGSMIDLNAPSDPRRAPADEPLVRMLSNLSRALDPGNPPITPVEAEMVLAYRQTLQDGRFWDERELLGIPGNPVTEEDFGLLEDFVTTWAWADPAMVAPMDPALVPAVGNDVAGRVPTGDVVREIRRPVDVNTAPREVLAAVFADLAALRIDRDLNRMPAGGTRWQATGRADRTTPVSFAQASSLAQAIVTRREATPFRNWAEFRSFLDAQVTGGAIDRLQALAILANCDPNVDTHRANPGLPVFREIDKFDLVVSTTEFSFSSMGVFEIESLGRVTHEGGEILAQARVRAAIEVYQVLRHTTQGDFERGRISTYRLEEPVLWRPEDAIQVEEDLLINGSPQILGSAGNIHSNQDLDLEGSPLIEGDATATGTYEASAQAQVLGQSGGGFERVQIPLFRPSLFRAEARYIFAADGKVYDAAGNEVGNRSYGSWNWQNGTWKWTGGQQLQGVLWFEGNVSLTSNTSNEWEVTIVATGSISVNGKPNLIPASRWRITLVSGTDLSVSGTPGAKISGYLYAGDQVELGGNTDFYGAIWSKGLSQASSLVTRNKIHGSVVFRYNRDLAPVPVDWVLSDPPALASHPHPRTIAATSDYDGWITLSTLITNRSILRSNPFRDRILARWESGSFDADLGGGAMGLVADAAGPVVAPVAGPGLAGHLLPDGVYSELDATPAYEATDNAGPLAGSIAFWIKPSWDGAAGSDSRSNKSFHLLSLSRTDDQGTQSFQFARTGDWPGPWANVAGFHFERTTLENPLAQRLLYSTWFPPAHRWSHVVLVYDFRAKDPVQAIAVYVNGVALPGGIRDFLSQYELTPDELARAAITPGNLLRLGERRGRDYELPASGADATFDELVTLPEKVDAAWAAAAYGAGRYYPAGDGWYESETLPIVAGSDLLWT